MKLSDFRNFKKLNLKQSKTVMSVVLAAGVLLGALAIGLTIRKFRSQPTEPEPQLKPPAEPDREQTVRTPGPDRQRRRRLENLSPEERARIRKERESMRERWENMTEQERKEFLARMRERARSRPRPGERRFRGLPPDETARLRMQIPGLEDPNLKKRWEDMSEQERQDYIRRVRERINTERRADVNERQLK